MKRVKKVRFFRDPAIKGIEICRVEKSHHVFPRHAHDDIYALSLITSGASYCLGKKNSELIVNAGELVLLNPGQIHSGEPVNGVPVSYWMLYADIATMVSYTDIFDQGGILPEFNSMIFNNVPLAKKFHTALMAFATIQSRLKKESILTEFFGDLVLAAGNLKSIRTVIGCENRAVSTAKEYLCSSLDQGITLEDVAQRVGFSRYHFIRLFKQHTGISPHQYRTLKRIQAAKQLIRKKMPLAQVALETGFVDQSHFTNKFGQYTGVTPTQYLVA